MRTVLVLWLMLGITAIRPAFAQDLGQINDRIQQQLAYAPEPDKSFPYYFRQAKKLSDDGRLQEALVSACEAFKVAEKAKHKAEAQGFILAVYPECAEKFGQEIQMMKKTKAAESYIGDSTVQMRENIYLAYSAMHKLNSRITAVSVPDLPIKDYSDPLAVAERRLKDAVIQSITKYYDDANLLLKGKQVGIASKIKAYHLLWKLDQRVRGFKDVKTQLASLEGEVMRFYTKQMEPLLAGGVRNAYTALDSLDKMQMLMPRHPQLETWRKTAESNTVLIDDRDKKAYKTIRVNNIIITAENLNYDAPGSQCYNDLPYYCQINGKFYNWSITMGGSVKERPQGICMRGWHIPSLAEWEEIIKACGGEYNTPKMLSSKGFVIKGHGFYPDKARRLIAVTDKGYSFTTHNTFWTSTRISSQDGISSVYIGPTKAILSKENFEGDAYPCRCILDAEK